VLVLRDELQVHGEQPAGAVLLNQAPSQAKAA
jgi:hypothetical protein